MDRLCKSGSGVKGQGSKVKVQTLGDCVWFHSAISDSYSHKQIQMDLVNPN